MKKPILIFGLLLFILFIAGCAKNQVACIKEDNCCTLDSDCTYIGYAGSCNTPEYITKKQKEAKEQGILIGESPSQATGTCTCENNLCITDK